MSNEKNGERITPHLTCLILQKYFDKHDIGLHFTRDSQPYSFDNFASHFERGAKLNNCVLSHYFSRYHNHIEFQQAHYRTLWYLNVNKMWVTSTQIYECFFPRDLVTSHFIIINLYLLYWLPSNGISILWIHIAYISCCYVGQTSDKLSGCQEQLLLKWYA